MIWTIIVVLVVLWLIGLLAGRSSAGFPGSGGWIHTLLVIAVILVILSLLGIV